MKLIQGYVREATLAEIREMWENRWASVLPFEEYIEKLKERGVVITGEET